MCVCVRVHGLNPFSFHALSYPSALPLCPFAGPRARRGGCATPGHPPTRYHRKPGLLRVRPTYRAPLVTVPLVTVDPMAMPLVTMVCCEYVQPQIS